MDYSGVPSVTLIVGCGLSCLALITLAVIYAVLWRWGLQPRDDIMLRSSMKKCTDLMFVFVFFLQIYPLWTIHHPAQLLPVYYLLQHTDPGWTNTDPQWGKSHLRFHSAQLIRCESLMGVLIHRRVKLERFKWHFTVWPWMELSDLQVCICTMWMCYVSCTLLPRAVENIMKVLFMIFEMQAEEEKLHFCSPVPCHFWKAPINFSPVLKRLRFESEASIIPDLPDVLWTK